MTTNEPRAAKTGAERVKKHRQRQRLLLQQAAFGIAKLVLGRGPGEQKRAVAAFLEKAAEDPGLPEDVVSAIEDAVQKLKGRTVY